MSGKEEVERWSYLGPDLYTHEVVYASDYDELDAKYQAVIGTLLFSINLLHVLRWVYARRGNRSMEQQVVDHIAELEKLKPPHIGPRPIPE